MFEEPAFWLFAFVVGFVVLRFWLKNWLRQRRIARRNERRRRQRGEVRGASDRLSATIRVEQRTSHEKIPGLTESEKKRLLATYAFGCAYCGQLVEAGTNLHWDHVLPLTLGGANHVANVVPACSSCNLRKGSKHPKRWYAELDRPPAHPGVAAEDHLVDSNLDRIRDAEFVFLMSGGEGPRADRAKSFLDAADNSRRTREARLDGARQALDLLVTEWRRSTHAPYPRNRDRVPLAAAYRQVRHLERWTDAPVRTIGRVLREEVEIEWLPVEEWQEKEAWRKELGKNIWGVRAEWY